MVLARVIICNQRVEQTRTHAKRKATATILSGCDAIIKSHSGIKCVLHVHLELEHVSLQLDQLLLKSWLLLFVLDPLHDTPTASLWPAPLILVHVQGLLYRLPPVFAAFGSTEPTTGAIVADFL